MLLKIISAPKGKFTSLSYLHICVYMYILYIHTHLHVYCVLFLNGFSEKQLVASIILQTKVIQFSALIKFNIFNF